MSSLHPDIFTFFKSKVAINWIIPNARHNYGSSFQLVGGIASHNISTSKLGENWFDENLGRTLYLEATVLEEVTGHFENASDVSVKIVSSPYVFNRDRTMNYFKPGLPFRVQASITSIATSTISETKIE